MKPVHAALLIAITALVGCNSKPAVQADGTPAKGGQTFELLNVSYDPTRELWKEFNGAFAAQYQKESGNTVKIKQSHGGSGSQARAVVDGLEADVATLAGSGTPTIYTPRSTAGPPPYANRTPSKRSSPRTRPRLSATAPGRSTMDGGVSSTS